MQNNNSKPKNIRLQEVLITTDTYLDELFKLLFSICYGYKWYGREVIFDKPHFLFIWPNRKKVSAYIIDESTLNTVWWFRNQLIRLFKVWTLMVPPAVLLGLFIVSKLQLNNIMGTIVLFFLVLVFSMLLPIKIGSTTRKKMNHTLANCISVTLPGEMSRATYFKTMYFPLLEGGLDACSEIMGTFVTKVFNPVSGKLASKNMNNFKELFTKKALNDLNNYYSSVVLTETGEERGIKCQ